MRQLLERTFKNNFKVLDSKTDVINIMFMIDYMFEVFLINFP